MYAVAQSVAQCSARSRTVPHQKNTKRAFASKSATIEETAMQTTCLERSKTLGHGGAMSENRQFKFWIALVIMISLRIAPARAQFGASLGGTVLDPSGAAIPNATVTLTNPATQQTQTKTTNATVYYIFNQLPP